MKRRVLLAIPFLLVLAFVLGPSTAEPSLTATMPNVNADVMQLDNFIASAESRQPTKEGSQARILWADSLPQKTEWSIVYLHGFSGSWHDGSPAIEQVAKELHANVFLARLHGHGLKVKEPLIDYSPDSVYASALQALAIGKQIGKKVVIIGTSTGATLGMMLAARYPSDVAAVVNWSPNVRLAHPLSFLSNGPWGLQLTRMIVGSDYRQVRMPNPERSRYWYMKYRIEAIPQLEALLESGMTEATFSSIRQPVLTMCWYKSDAIQDSLVSVPAMRTMHEQLASTRKQFIPLDADAHEIGYAPESKSVNEVIRRTVEFLQ